MENITTRQFNKLAAAIPQRGLVGDLQATKTDTVSDLIRNSVEDEQTAAQRRARARQIATGPRIVGELNTAERAIIAALKAAAYELRGGSVTNNRTGEQWRHERNIVRRSA